MYFVLQCSNKHPDEFASFVRNMRDQLFHIPVEDEDEPKEASATKRV